MNAIFKEFLAHRRINTYTIMRRRVPVGRSLLPSRLILRHKFNGKGVVIRKKARLCIREDKQTPDVDYFETFASVVRYDTFRFLMAKVAAKDLNLDHVNVETAFLNPTLQEEIYIQIPDLLREFLPELKGVEDAYLKLNKSLYGLKQAPRE
jgi:ATP-binding cassette subfamily B (MDR/TAP) protein 1